MTLSELIGKIPDTKLSPTFAGATLAFIPGEAAEFYPPQFTANFLNTFP